MPSDYRLVPIKPVSGLFDVRSLPDEVGAGSFRLVKSMSVRGVGKRCRRGGWVKLLDGVNPDYNNEDLHDQLLGEQIYYTGYSEFLSFGGEFDHYAYSYYHPTEYFPGFNLLESDSLNHLGNPYTGGYPLSFSPNTCWAYFYYSGPPFAYYRTMCHHSADGYLAEGYPYGPYEPQYTPEVGYFYDYCGTVPLVRGGCREAITYLAEFRSPRNFRKLVVGTKSRLYSLNERTGNWRILADGLGGTINPAEDCVGCAQRRFLSAQMDSILVLTNDFDPVLYWYFDDAAQLGDGNNCDLWSATPILDLVDLNVTKVGCVAEHKGFMFFCAVEQDGAFYPHRVIWSDYKNPISVIPTTDSLAGFQDIGSGERILRAEPLGDYLYLYTDQAIHRGSLVSTGEVWNFEQIYRGQDALKYKFSLINTGDEHFYLSEDKIMVMTLSDANPLEVPWMRPSSPVIFAGIDAFETLYGPLNNDQCDLVTGGYNSVLKELWWSWPSGTSLCPDVSLVFNLTRQQEAADLVDHGFTAFCVYESDQLPTVNDWLIEMGLCAAGDLPPVIKEGPPADSQATATASPTSIWNETEDPDLPADPNSLCALLGDRTPEDFCRGCVGKRRFVMASASDRCLKQYEDSLYYREELVGNSYVLQPYDSVIESGSENLRIDQEKVCKGLKVEFRAEPQTSPSTLLGWLGFGAEASCTAFKNLRKVNPDGTVEAGVPLRCLTEFTSSEHAANMTRASLPGYFNAAVRGRFLAYRLAVRGTGGAFCISMVGMDIAKAEH